MNFLRNLFVIIVFLVMWKEVSTEEISPRKDLNERTKRNHESDHININHIKLGREKKNILNESGNQETDINKENKVPRNRNKIVHSRPLLRINPSQRYKTLKTNRKPFIMHVPKYGLLSKNNNIDDQYNANETLPKDTGVQEEDVVVNEIKEEKDKEQVDNTITTEKIREANEKSKTENIDDSEEDLLSAYRKTKLKWKKKEQKTKDIYKETNDDAANKMKFSNLIVGRSQQDKLNKTLRTESNTDKTEKETKSETKSDKKTLEIVEEGDIDKKIKTKEEMVMPKENFETKQIKHPLLNMIKNDRSNIPLLDSLPILKDIKETKNNVIETNINTKNSTNILKESATDEKQTSVDITQDNDDNAEIIIKNNNFEEIMERRPHQASSQAPFSHQTPYNYQTRSDFDINRNYYNHNNYNNNYPPDEQRTVQTDGNTVVSYNNYFKHPSYNYDRNNYSNNRYGYPINQKDGWNYGRGYWQSNGVANERIWRTWKNTEYYLKSRNAKKVDNEHLNNLLKQNNFSDKAKFMLSNGNYIKQNNSYL